MLAVVLLLASASANALAETSRPNILLIIADDLGFTDLGSFGGEIRTPNLDELAARGVRFSQFHTAPQCAATRAMLFSGNNNHVAGADPSRNLARLSSNIVPFPRVLADAGYRTIMVGKWHLGLEASQSPAAAGFERSFALAHGGSNHFTGGGLTEAGTIFREDGRLANYPAGTFSTAVFTERLEAFLDEGRDDPRPFLAVASYTAPHWPLQLPETDRELYAGRYDAGYGALRRERLAGAKRAGVIERAHALPPRDPEVRPWDALSAAEQRSEAREMELLAGMIENLDRHIGDLFARLEASGELENTLVFFLSDNGANAADPITWPRSEYLRAHYDNSLENMGSASSWVSIGPEWAEASSAPFRRYKQFTLQGGVVSPMIVAGPGVAMAGDVSSAFVTVMDIAATVIEVAGAQYPARDDVAPLRGVSMVEHLAGRADAVHEAAWAHAFMHQGRAFLRQGNWKLVSTTRPFHEEAFELYDLDADPGEAVDLRASMPERFAQILELWRRRSVEVGVQLPSEH